MNLSGFQQTRLFKPSNSIKTYIQPNSFEPYNMTSKATQEYRLSFITLISHLSEIEQKGQEFFDKM